jgi:V8-like Glu-specific endopeptidase
MNDRLDKLRRMLEQVDPSGQSAGLKENIEGLAKRFEGPTLEGQPVSPMRVEAEIALESLDLIEDGKEIDSEHQFVLEAIVMPYYRPVVDIVDNRMKAEQLTTKWTHIGGDLLRQRIEECFLSVGRIEVPNLRSLPYAGTGFIVGEGLLMTNRHVAEIFAQGVGQRWLQFQPGQVALIDFYRENGGASSETLRVEKVILIHPYWDMALLKVSGLPANRRPLSLTTADPATLLDREVVVVGYPGYDPTGDDEFQRIQNRIFRGTFYVKRLQPGLLKTRDQIESYDKRVDAVTHDCSTLGGNSGSAVLVIPRSPTDPIQVAGLHFAGDYLVSNYAVSTYDLAQDSRVVDAGVNFAGRVEPRGGFYSPIWDQAETEPTASAGLTAAVGNLIQSPAEGSAAGIQMSGGAETWTIPLHISVSLGMPQSQAAPTTGVSPAPVEGLFGRKKPVPAAAFMARFSVSSLSSETFDWKAALCLALASSLSYSSQANVESTARNAWGLQSCRFIEKDDTQCFVASSADRVLIAFRGTESVGDWMANLNTLSTSQSYGSVHRGFHTGFSVVRPQIEQELKSFSDRAIVLTGHSLGGALATIAAAEWRGVFPVTAIYTYGQPAVGKGRFPAFMRQHYAGKFFRIVNNDDVVPQVPPTYQHVGRLFRFDASGHVKTRTEAPDGGLELEGPPMMSEAEFDRLRAQLLERRAAQRSAGKTESLEAPALEWLLPSVSDHSLDAYIAKIAAMAPP